MSHTVIPFPPALYRSDREAENNVLGKKLQNARKAQGMSLALLCEKLRERGVAVGPAAVSKWELGKSVPNAYQLIAVCDILMLPVDLSFLRSDDTPSLLNPEGEKKVREYIRDLVASGLYAPFKMEDALPESYREMPVSDLPASAGTGVFLDEGRFEKIRVPAGDVPDNADFGLYVSGDSMEPVYHDKQIVWVEKCSSLRPGETGIFLYDGDGYIKVYEQRMPPEEDRDAFTDSYGQLSLQTLLCSMNPAYKPIVVRPEAEFAIIGRVLKSREEM